jgi:hypothetical protein
LAAARAPLKDDEILSYLFAGLPADNDPFVMSMTTKNEELSLDDVFSHLLVFEAWRLQHEADLQVNMGMSAHYAGHDGGRHGRGRVVHLDARTLAVQLVARLARRLVVAHGHRAVVAMVGLIDPNVKSATNSAITPSTVGIVWMRTIKMIL